MVRALPGSALVLALLALLATGCGPSGGLGGLTLVPGDPEEGPLQVVDHRQRETLRFLVFGDSGTGHDTQWMVAEGMGDRCLEDGCDFALLLGDAIYPSGVRPPRLVEGELRHDADLADRFERPYELLGRLDVFVVPGNHDWKRRESVPTQIAYSRHSPRWRMPANHFAVPRLPDWIRIYGLDTTLIRRGGDVEQIEAARQHLCDPEPSSPRAPDRWRLLFGHHPVYASGPHAGRDGAMEEIRDALLEPLIEACDVHVFFAGHEHHQEHLRAPAFDQVIQGAAAWLRRPRPRRGDDGVTEVMRARELLGFAMVEASPDSLTLRSYQCHEDRGCTELHCEIIDRAGFADPETRSRTCS